MPDRGANELQSRSNTVVRRAARGSALNLAGSFVSALSSFGLTVVITRMVSGQEAGVFFSATSLFLLAVAVSALGTSTGLVYFLSRARAQGELRHAKTYMRVAAPPVLVASVLLGIGIFLAATPIGGILSPERESEFADYLRIMAFFIPWAAIMQLALAGTQGLGSMKPFAALENVCRPLLQLILIGVALAVFDDSAIGWLWTAAYLPTAALAWFWWRRLRDGASAQIMDADFRPKAAFWRFSAPRALANVTQVAMQRLDIILVGALAGLEAAAIYTAATRLLVLGQMVARAVSVSGQPLLGESLANSDLSEAKHLYRVTTGWLVIVTWPWYLTLIVWGPVLLMVFGDEYLEGAQALVVLAVAMLIATSCGMVDMVLNMGGKSVWNLVNVICAFTANITINLILIPRIGLMGAAIGWATAILLANLLPLVQVWAMLKLHPFGQGTLIGGACALVCFGFVPGIFLLATDLQLATLPWAVGVGVALYLVLMVLLRERIGLATFYLSLRRRRALETVT